MIYIVPKIKSISYIVICKGLKRNYTIELEFIELATLCADKYANMLLSIFYEVRSVNGQYSSILAYWPFVTDLQCTKYVHGGDFN